MLWSAGVADTQIGTGKDSTSWSGGTAPDLDFPRDSTEGVGEMMMSAKLTSCVLLRCCSVGRSTTTHHSSKNLKEKMGK